MNEIYKTIHNPYRIVEMFEEEVANYTHAPYAVAISSCTEALFLCCLASRVEEVTIPSRTYLSVPQSILQAQAILGHTSNIVFDTTMDEWVGMYELYPTMIYDAAKRFTSGMYQSNTFMCLSFHDKKILKIGKGGMILTDNKEFADWFKIVRYEGRTEVNYHKDEIEVMGYNMYMTPEQAARGLTLMRNIPLHNEDQIEEGGYKYLPDFSIFKKFKVEKLVEQI